MVEIKYKRRKTSPNPRIVKLRETGYLYASMIQAAQIKHDIEKSSIEKQLPIVDMNPSVIPSYMLWALADNYLDMYNILQKENLIKSGNISKISPTIH